MQIELLANPAGGKSRSGRFADVSKCTYQGLEVAIKVLRGNSDSKFKPNIARMSYL